MAKTVPKPLGIKYVRNPTTIGQKIRNRRLELRLLQKDVAERIGVSEMTVSYWETGFCEPDIHSYPALIRFLGYFPFEVDTSTLGGRIRLYRYVRGISQDELAKDLDVDESTVFHYEAGRHTPQKRVRKRLELMLAGVEEVTKVKVLDY